MLNVAMIGMGGISRTHMSAWLLIPEAKVTAVCDIRSECTAAAAARTGAREYADFDKLLDSEKIDILDICLPTYLHADYAVKAVSRGIHVLTEKPVSLKHADIARIYGSAREKGVRVMVAQVLRFWFEYECLKRAVDEGTYGKLLSGSMSRLGSTPEWSWDGWMTDPARSGLVPFDLHIHDLDFIVYAFGKPHHTQISRAREGRQDCIHAVYQYQDFFISSDAAWYDCAYGFECGYRFQFERAVMEYKDGKLTVFKQNKETEKPADSREASANGINLPDSNAYYNEIRYFTDCVLKGADCGKVRPDELEAVLDILTQF